MEDRNAVYSMEDQAGGYPKEDRGDKGRQEAIEKQHLEEVRRPFDVPVV
jgi:hypothetical protein